MFNELNDEVLEDIKKTELTVARALNTLVTDVDSIELAQLVQAATTTAQAAAQPSMHRANPPRGPLVQPPHG